MNADEPADAGTPSRRHLLDATMFWSPRGGGVRRYLLAKRDWLRGDPAWCHTLVAPGARGPGMVDAGGLPLPFSGGYRVPWSRRALARLLAAQSPDVIEVADPYVPAWAAIDAGQRLGIPTVAFCHSDLPALAQRLLGGHGPLARWGRRRAQRYLQRLYAGFDLVLAPSRAMTQSLQSLGIAAQRQPLGVDTQLFHPARRDAAWRGTLGLPADARLVLYAGRFAAEKNLPLLVQAVQRLGEPWWLLALGSGPLPPHGERVLRLPHLAETAAVARVLASVDVFAHAGDQETFGLAALEAMACGTPAVLRSAGGLAELAEGRAAIAVASERVDDWAEALAAAVAGDREAAGRAARHRALAHDWTQVMPMLMRRYAGLATRLRLTGDESTEPAVVWRGAAGKDLA